MKDLKLPKLSKDELLRVSQRAVHGLHHYRILIVSTLVLILLGYAVIEVGKVANTTITPQQEQQKQAELASKKIDFDEELINQIQQRLDEDVEVNPQDLGTDNPFRFN